MTERKVSPDDLENRVFGIATTEKDQFLKVLCLTLNRIGEDDRSTLLDTRNVIFVIPVQSTAERTFMNPLINRDERFDPLIPVWLISLRPDLIRAKRHEIIYTVVHELAHAFLEHGFFQGSALEGLKETEIAADQKVIEWGFETELRETPHNYLYGAGLKNWGLPNFR